MTKPQAPVGLPTSKSAHPLRQELDSISLENVARSPGFTDGDFDNESCSVVCYTAGKLMPDFQDDDKWKRSRGL
ncbi:hypothetical protein RRG08_011938 [Elysia crispata]|uniref:Uncharacterized protein n=1 Tax=Elysia crispata TaxID=231223 RepID=A0AAE0Z3A9_9GAST|nr:hypothetical protein RRG08_011938 [Elysia crispata]